MCTQCPAGSQPGHFVHAVDLPWRASSQPNGSYGAPDCVRCLDFDERTASTDGSACQVCPAGFNPNENATACVECAPGRASLTGAPCHECFSGQAPTLNRSVCVGCQAGRFSPDGVDCLSGSHCDEHFPGMDLPANLQPKTCTNRYGASKNVSDQWACELTARVGHVWNDTVPGFCTSSDGEPVMVNVGDARRPIMVGVDTEPECTKTISGYHWDSVWEVCRDADGAEIPTRAEVFACLFTSTGNTWTPLVPHSCTDAAGNPFDADTALTCRFARTGF
eukprot:SAG22_NODE_4051_length_1405_cov_1.330781_2_plen_277_part_01